MPLNDAEKERTRYHLGYPEVQPAASIQFGIPKPIQTAFLVELAMNNLIEMACDRVRSIIQVMDGVETKLVESQMRLAAIKLDKLELRENEPDQLEHEYVRWGMRLADILGVPIYAYSTRYRGLLGTKAGSIPVR
jgi:hypothetical protein